MLFKILNVDRFFSDFKMFSIHWFKPGISKDGFWAIIKYLFFRRVLIKIAPSVDLRPSVRRYETTGYGLN